LRFFSRILPEVADKNSVPVLTAACRPLEQPPSLLAARDATSQIENWAQPRAGKETGKKKPELRRTAISKLLGGSRSVASL